MADDIQNNQQTPSEEPSIDYEARWKRALADHENYKKDETKRFAVFAQFNRASMIRDILPLFDMFERALANVPQEKTESSAWIEGVRHIYDEFLLVLNKNGIKKIETLGKPFDPKYHESVGRTDETGEDICEEVRSGFVMNDDFVVRPAQVKIGTKPNV